MDKDSPYYKQVSLLIRMLPVVATETVFALKGGTAINLFVRDFPRLSVDIDLAYLPLEPRDEALINVRAALQRITDRINTQPDIRAAFAYFGLSGHLFRFHPARRFGVIRPA